MALLRDSRMGLSFVEATRSERSYPRFYGVKGEKKAVKYSFPVVREARQESFFFTCVSKKVQIFLVSDWRRFHGKA